MNNVHICFWFGIVLLEPLAEQIPVGIKINEEFKDEYEDLNNLETKKLVARIEQGVSFLS